MRVGDTLPAVQRAITQDQIERYAAASGDFNPIHVDRDFAAASQFGGTIAHGMLVAATISEMMTRAFSEDWLRGGRLKIRFKAPVRPGDGVTAFGSVSGIREEDGARHITCSVGVRKHSGEDAITGEAAVRIPLPTSG